VSPLKTTVYTVTATTIGLSDTKSVTVFIEPRPDFIPNVNIGNDETVCIGDTVQLIPTSNVSNTAVYKWSTGETTKTIYITPTQTAYYTVVITDGDYVITDGVLIIVSLCD
jgi:hypothetical protein